MTDSTPGWHRQPDGRERFWDGTEWTDQFRDPTPSPPAAQEKKKSGCLGLVALIVGASAFLAVVDSCGGDKRPSPEQKAYGVQETCKDLVRKSLKNPSTAKFSDGQQGSTFASGVVVAENALGGKVTMDYRCTADANDMVRLIKLDAR
ncbi:MAG TPA: DUF2510 domain-containing protein [Brevibacterium sp.]|nr:DUF2510 domain-containing protein [Brevibacterium sp.]